MSRRHGSGRTLQTTAPAPLHPRSGVRRRAFSGQLGQTSCGARLGHGNRRVGMAARRAENSRTKSSRTEEFPRRIVSEPRRRARPPLAHAPGREQELSVPCEGRPCARRKATPRAGYRSARRAGSHRAAGRTSRSASSKSLLPSITGGLRAGHEVRSDAVLSSRPRKSAAQRLRSNPGRDGPGLPRRGGAARASASAPPSDRARPAQDPLRAE